MPDVMYPSATRELAQNCRELSVEAEAAFQALVRKGGSSGTVCMKVAMAEPSFVVALQGQFVAMMPLAPILL